MCSLFYYLDYLLPWFSVGIGLVVVPTVPGVEETVTIVVELVLDSEDKKYKEEWK